MQWGSLNNHSGETCTYLNIVAVDTSLGENGWNGWVTTAQLNLIFGALVSLKEVRKEASCSGEERVTLIQIHIESTTAQRWDEEIQRFTLKSKTLFAMQQS